MLVHPIENAVFDQAGQGGGIGLLIIEEEHRILSDSRGDLAVDDIRLAIALHLVFLYIGHSSSQAGGSERLITGKKRSSVSITIYLHLSLPFKVE